MRQQKPLARHSRFLRGFRSVVAPAVVCGLLASSAVAQNDIEMLLSELTFGQSDPPGDGDGVESAAATPPSPPPDEPPPLRDPSAADSPRSDANPQPEKLQPAAPIRFPRPSDEPAAADEEADRPSKSTRSKPADSKPADSKPADSKPPRSGAGRSGSGEPVPSPAPETATPEAVDFHQVFSDPGIYGGEAALAHVAGHPGAHPGQAAAYRHAAPALPPPSTFLGYFRSRPCNAEVWAGFEDERYVRCQTYHKHLHGQCDCFEPRQKLGSAAAHHRCCPDGCDHTR